MKKIPLSNEETIKSIQKGLKSGFLTDYHTKAFLDGFLCGQQQASSWCKWEQSSPKQRCLKDGRIDELVKALNQIVKKARILDGAKDLPGGTIGLSVYPAPIAGLKRFTSKDHLEGYHLGVEEFVREMIEGLSVVETTSGVPRILAVYHAVEGASQKRGRWLADCLEDWFPPGCPGEWNTTLSERIAQIEKLVSEALPPVEPPREVDLGQCAEDRQWEDWSEGEWDELRERSFKCRSELRELRRYVDRVHEMMKVQGWAIAPTSAVEEEEYEEGEPRSF